LCRSTRNTENEQGDDATQRIIKLFVVARNGLTPERLSAYLQSHLKTNEIPDKIVFVDKVPRGPMGKVLRRLFQELPASVVSKVGSVLKMDEIVAKTADDKPDPDKEK